MNIFKCRWIQSNALRWRIKALTIYITCCSHSGVNTLLFLIVMVTSYMFSTTLTGHIHFRPHTPHSQTACSFLLCVCVYVKCLWTNTDNCYCLSEDVLKKKKKKMKRFTLCLCSGISSGGLLQKLVHRAFTKLKIYFWKLLYLYKLSRFVAPFLLFVI